MISDEDFLDMVVGGLPQYQIDDNTWIEWKCGAIDVCTSTGQRVMLGRSSDLEAFLARCRTTYEDFKNG